MFKWLKKILPNHQTIEHSQSLKRVRGYLRDPALWRLNCSTVAKGVGIGLFSAIMPFPQMLIAAILAIFLQGNLPIAVIMTWVSNPITFVPITYAIYLVGNFILNQSTGEISIERIHWNYSSVSAIWHSFADWFLQFGKAFFVGLPIVAIGMGLAGYLITILIWGCSDAWKKKSKK